MYQPYSRRSDAPASAFWLLLWLLLAGPLAIGQPVLVKDIHPQPAAPGKNAFVNLNGTLFFAASNATNGAELFKSDLNVTKIELVKDILPGAAGASPAELLLINSTIYFTTSNGLYRSDGTNAGTTLVRSFGSRPASLVNANGTLFFAVNAGSTGTQLWKSNGTNAGTVLVKEITPAPPGYAPFKLVAVNSIVFFVGIDETHGAELWKSDGTANGTGMVKDINPGAAIEPYMQYAPLYLTAFKGAVYFSADDGVHGRELWKSNGTAGGTVLVKDIGVFDPETAQLDGTPSQLTVTDNALFFVTNLYWYSSQLFKTDGTTDGTVMLADYVPPRPGPVSSIFSLTAVNEMVYYEVVTFSPSFGAAVSLHGSNGTIEGTGGVYGFTGGGGNGDGPSLGSFINVNGALCFVGNDGITGSEIWKSDAGNTVLLPEVVPGPEGSNPYNLINLNGVLFYHAGSDALGARQWKYDISQPFTGEIRINAGGPEAYHLFEPEYPNPLVSYLYYYFSPDVYYIGGNKTPTSSAPSSWSVYESQRWGAFNYNIPVTKGAYKVTLHFFENYWGHQRTGGAGSRKFNVDMEGSRKLTEYDIFAKAEGALMPVLETFLVNVTDGTLNIAFLKGSADNPTVCAIEVIPTVAPNQAPVLAAIGNRTATIGQPVAFTAQSTDPDGDALSYSLLNAPAGTAINATTGAFSWTPTQAGTFTFRVKVTDNGYPAASDEEQITVTVQNTPTVTAFRVNAGGNPFSTIDARRFAADAYFSGGVVSTATTAAIAGTADDYLYQTGRHGSSFSYNFPTGNGSYDVVLHFAETYWGNTAPGGIGSRKFHVNMEGVRKLTDYDVFARAGGALRVAQEKFRVQVSDGTLNLSFLKGSADNPAIKAIEVLPAGSGLTINSGGGMFTSGSGKVFVADVYFAQGSVSSIASGDILNTADDALYRNARFGPSFSYGLPSGNGTFDVVLHFVETYFGSRAAGGIGSRRFNVDMEGARRLTNYDIFAKAGGAMRAVKETMRVTVTDGVLNLYFAKGASDNAIVSAIEVLPVTAAARITADDLRTSEGWQVTLYPNPVQDKLTVGLPFSVTQVKETTVTDAAGTPRLLNAHTTLDEQQLQIRVESLQRGLYLLKIETNEGYTLVKFIKQ